MVKSYLKSAFRHLRKNGLNSGINIVGLAISLTAMVLSILYYIDEHNFDTFHKNNPHLYRITTTYIDNKSGQKETSGGTGQVQGPAFKTQLPEIIAYTRIWGGDIIENVKSADKAFDLGTAFVDSTFFKVFSFPLLYGDPNTALNNRHSVVISERTALKFFGTTNVVGKRLDVADNPDSLFASFTITGVTQNPPANSSIQFDILIPFSYMNIMFDDTNWLNPYLGTFVVVHPQADIKKLERKFTDIHTVNAGNQLKQAKEKGEFDKQTFYSLQRVTDIHLNPLYRSSTSREGGSSNGSNPVHSYFLLGISLFILLMASINFTNLSIAGSVKRAKEIGIRKVNGSSKRQIIYQFLVESAIICCMAMILALFLTEITLPFFNQLANKQLQFLSSPGRWLIYLGGLLTLNTIFAGLYPAYTLAKFKPTEVLYKKYTISGRNWLGKGLVVFQFTLSICLIISSVIYYKQMNFVQTKELGYNPHNIIRVNIPPRRETKQIYTQFKNELAKEPGITQLSLEASLDGGYKMTVNNKPVKGNYRLVEESYIPMLQISLQKGRNFSASYGTDKTDAAIVNEAFVKTAGLKNPLGQQIRTQDWFVNKTLTIVGVVKDYHYSSLRQAIQPLVLTMTDQQQGTILLKINKARYRQSLAAIEKVYRKAIPGSEYSYTFWNDLNAREYDQERKWQKIITIATCLSIFICCLGLFGLTNLATNQRVKEIGIRKVLGASPISIATLLSMSFFKLVILGFIVASPIAWWVMNNWLQDFAYRTDIDWWIFLVAGILAIIVTLLTISMQTIKAATKNPVTNLRSE